MFYSVQLRSYSPYLLDYLKKRQWVGLLIVLKTLERNRPMLVADTQRGFNSKQFDCITRLLPAAAAPKRSVNMSIDKFSMMKELYLDRKDRNERKVLREGRPWTSVRAICFQ